jgi:O-antigen/teichoic acid export membrane protein
VSTAAPPTNYKQTVLRSVYWQASGQFVAQAFTWLVSLFVIRLLAPGDYGLMATAGVFVNLLAMVSELGLGASIIQARNLDRDQLAGIAGFVYLVSGTALVLTHLAAPLVALAFNEPRVEPLLRLLSVCFVLTALYTIPQSLLVRELRFRAKASVEVAAAVTGSCTSLGMALAGAGVWSLVGSMIALHATKAILFNVVGGRPIRPHWSFARARAQVAYGSTVTLGRIANHFNSTMDIIIGGRFLGVDLLGLYTVALTIASIPLDKALPAVTQVSFAAFSRIQSDLDRVIRNLLQAVRVVSLFAFPVFIGVAAVAADLVPLVIGDRWVDVVKPLQLISVVLPLKAVAVLVPPALFAIGRPGMNLTNMLISLAIMTVAFMIGVGSGVVGLATAWVIAYPVVFLITNFRALRVLGVPLKELIASIAIPAGAAALMGGAVHMLKVTLLVSLFGPLRLVLLALFGAALYAALLLPYRQRAMSDLNMLRKT